MRRPPLCLLRARSHWLFGQQESQRRARCGRYRRCAGTAATVAAAASAASASAAVAAASGIYCQSWRDGVPPRD
eukprot:4626461-Lingulodinium_polyedra.AAC.1